MTPDGTDQDEIDRARRGLRAVESAVALTGAGVSAASGVPTFRGEDGLWKDYRPEELATPRAFEDDPRLVWEWYAWRRRQVRGCEPNAAHRALARWTLRRRDVLLVTQNVDDLHRAAVEDAAADASVPDHARTVELHGSLFRARCTGCGSRRRHRKEIDASNRSSLPRCPACGGLLRPDVVWFGEPLPRGALERAMEAARGAAACLVAGTSAAVQPAASVASVAADAGALLVEVNPERTPLSRRAEHSFRGGAEELLPALLDDGPRHGEGRGEVPAGGGGGGGDGGTR